MSYSIFFLIGVKSKNDDSSSLQNRLHEELKRQVSINAKKKPGICYITPHSIAEEVQFWLISKGFSAKSQQVFQNVKGEEIFQLTLNELVNELGHDEGVCLFHQIAVQKNACGFKRSRKRELGSFLKYRRKRIDPDDECSDRRDSNDSFDPSFQ